MTDTDNTPAYSITKDASENRYVVHHDDTDTGFLSYSEDDRTITIEHTVVDEAHQGQGVAGDLVKFALDDLAARTDKRIEPACSYARMWIARHPEYQYLTER